MALMDVCESSRKWWAYEAWNTAEAPQNSTLTTILSTDESWTGTQTWRTRKHRGDDAASPMLRWTRLVTDPCK